jgi:hypothetical protein
MPSSREKGEATSATHNHLMAAEQSRVEQRENVTVRLATLFIRISGFHISFFSLSRPGKAVTRAFNYVASVLFIPAKFYVTGDIANHKWASSRVEQTTRRHRVARFSCLHDLIPG